MTFTLLRGSYAICRLGSSDEIPSWAGGSEFASITRTRLELSIVCDEGLVPSEVRAERGWRCLALAGPIPFDQTGIAAAFLKPLADAEVGVFVVSTYDTDYVLVKAVKLELAVSALRGAGYEVIEA